MLTGTICVLKMMVDEDVCFCSFLPFCSFELGEDKNGGSFVVAFLQKTIFTRSFRILIFSDECACAMQPGGTTGN